MSSAINQLLSGSLLDYALPRADLLRCFDTEISEVVNQRRSTTRDQRPITAHIMVE